MKKCIFTVLFLTPIMIGQDTDIVSITPLESVQAEQLYRNLRAALAAWEINNKLLRDKYLAVPCLDPDGKQNPKSGGARLDKSRCLIPGYDVVPGFKFTSDFRHLLPRQKPLPDGIFDCTWVRP